MEDEVVRMRSIPGLPPEVSEALHALCGNIQVQFPGCLSTVTLYGSAARGLYRPRRSDVDVWIVLKALDGKGLARLNTIFAEARARIDVRPFLMQVDEIDSVAQAFPNRFLDMKRGYVVLAGEDLLKDVRIDEARLADRCRDELLNILLRVRYCMSLESDAGGPEEIAARFLPSFTKSMRTLLYIRTGELVDDRAELVRRAAELWSLPEEPFSKLLAWRREELHLNAEEWNEALGDFLTGIEKVVHASNG